MGNSENDLQKACPTAKVEKGLAIRGGAVKNADRMMEQWVAGTTGLS